MSFKLVGYCIICWCCNILLHFITVIYTCCCKSNYSSGQVPAVGSEVGRFVGTQNVSKIAALESFTDAPVDRDVDNCCWAWTLGVTIALSKSPSQAGRVVGKLRAQVYLKDCSLLVFSGSVMVSWDPTGLLLILPSQHLMVSMMEAKTSLSYHGYFHKFTQLITEGLHKAFKRFAPP